MIDSSHNYEESDEYLEDASDVDEREFVESGSEDDGEAEDILELIASLSSRAN